MMRNWLYYRDRWYPDATEEERRAEARLALVLLVPCLAFTLVVAWLFT